MIKKIKEKPHMFGNKTLGYLGVVLFFKEEIKVATMKWPLGNQNGHYLDLKSCASPPFIVTHYFSSPCLLFYLRFTE